MKEYFKKLLKANNLYYRLKYSPVFHFYQRLFKPAAIAHHKKEVALYSRFPGKCKLIFDIGAHDGHKTAAFLELAEKVVACEPDPHNYELLKTRFRTCTRLEILNVAISETQGTAILQRNDEGSAFNTLNVEWSRILESDDKIRWNEKIQFKPELAVTVETNTLDQLIMKYGVPDFIKIDVEGFEKQVIQGLSTAVKGVSFECLLPEFATQAKQIIELLLKKNENYLFNVIFDEDFIFPHAVNHSEILNWLDSTSLFTFDMLAMLNEN